MNAFPWARRPAPERLVHLVGDRPLYVVSDVHLGDGTRSDAFVGKDADFLAFLARVRADGAHLVIAGDIIDFPQALTFTRVVRAHGEVLGALSELPAGVTYVWGNHDHDIALYRDLLRWDVCSEVHIGEHVCIRHGHQYDPYIAARVREAALATLVHHQLERLFRTWVRTPLEDFYTLTNRLTWWLVRRTTQASRFLERGLRRLGLKLDGEGRERYLRYWLRSQVGDPMNVFPGVRAALRDAERPVLVCGHSHLPGKVEVAPGRFYVNSGSWTFRCTHYVHWGGARLEVRDWSTGRVFGDERYRPLLSGRLEDLDFDRWWAGEYLGWLRFRCGELRRRGVEMAPWYLEAPAGEPAGALTERGA